MEELLEKIDNLKKSLNNNDIVKNIKRLNLEILNDKELINMIKRYKESPNEELKYQIYSNKLYREYKKNETDLNLLILSMNTELKKINNKEHCL